MTDVLTETHRTHSEECYRWHHRCAIAEVERLRLDAKRYAFLRKRVDYAAGPYRGMYPWGSGAQMDRSLDDAMAIAEERARGEE